MSTAKSSIRQQQCTMLLLPLQDKIYQIYSTAYITPTDAALYTAHDIRLATQRQSPTPPDRAFENATSKSETATVTASATASTTATNSTADSATQQQQQLRRTSNINDSTASSNTSMHHSGYLILLYPVLLDCLVTRSRPV
eukprot:1927-Heterococcus_DN1.PRE.1